MNLRRVLWIVGWLLIAFVIAVCLVPNAELPQTPEFLTDKVNHLIAHGGLALWFAGLVARPHWWRVFLWLVALGLCIELAQHLMGYGRAAEFSDVIANTAGTLLGLVLARLGLERWPDWLGRLAGGRATP
jgi:VanZ family protein